MNKTTAPAAQPASLYDIGTEFLALEAALMESGGEWTEEIEARFGSLQQMEMTQEKKVDSYIALLKRSEIEQQAPEALKKWHQDQAKALDKAVKAAETFRERLKRRLCEHMERLNTLKLTGSVWNFRRDKSSTKREVTVSVPVELLPAQCRRWVPPHMVEGYWEVDEDALRKALVAREEYLARCAAEEQTPEPHELDGKASIGPQAYHVKIV